MGRYNYYYEGKYPLNHRLAGMRKKWFRKNYPSGNIGVPINGTSVFQNYRERHGPSDPAGANHKLNNLDVIKDYVGRRWVMPFKAKRRAIFNRRLPLIKVHKSLNKFGNFRDRNARFIQNEDWMRELLSYI